MPAKATARSKSRTVEKKGSPAKAVERKNASSTPTRAKQAQGAVKVRGKSGARSRGESADVKMTGAAKKGKAKETKTAKRAPARELRSGAKK